MVFKPSSHVLCYEELGERSTNMIKDSKDLLFFAHASPLFICFRFSSLCPFLFHFWLAVSQQQVISVETLVRIISTRALKRPSTALPSVIRRLETCLRMASSQSELTGAAGRRYFFKKLFQERAHLGRVWLATFESISPFFPLPFLKN